MNKIIYKNTDLFTAQGNNTVLVHTAAVRPKYDNTETTKKFKEIFPICYKDYLLTCALYKKKKILNSLLGKSFWIGYPDCKQRVAFLFVSKTYGKWQDNKNIILKNTDKAIRQLLNNLPESIEIHSYKLNLENFNVPWRATEKLINKILQDYPKHKWIIHGEP